MQKKINEQNEMLKMVFDRLIEVKSEGWVRDKLIELLI
jgi:hypothetical protein